MIEDIKERRSGNVARGAVPLVIETAAAGPIWTVSNTAVGRFIRDQFDGLAGHMVLAHLSSKNNHPQIAKKEAERALRDRGFANTQLMLTSQEVPRIPIRL